MISLDTSKNFLLSHIGTSFTQQELLLSHKFGVSIFNSQTGAFITDVRKFGGVSACASPGGCKRLAIVGTYEERTITTLGAPTQSIPDQNYNIDNPGPRTVALLEDGELKGIIPMPTQIINVKMTTKHLIIILEFGFYVYKLNEDFTGGESLLFKETQQNLYGACDVTSDGKYLLVPGKEVGQFEIFSLIDFTCKSKSEDKHSHAIGALAISKDGSHISSGSVESNEARLGTYENDTTKMPNTFVRGSTLSRLTSLRFSDDNRFFALNSNSGNKTFHFYLTDKKNEGLKSWLVIKKRTGMTEIKSFTAGSTGLVIFLPKDSEGNTPFNIVTEDLKFYSGMIKSDMSFVEPSLKSTLNIDNH